MSRDVRITDSTLRDGSHAMAHQFTEGQVRQVVSVLDAAGVEVIEVSHGDGLGGSSFNYGFSGTDEISLVRAAAQEASQAKIAVLLLPGVGTAADLRAAREAGASVARIATHCTEADVSVRQEGATQVDGALCALGAGAGNAPTEVLAATFDRLGIRTGVDVQGVLAAAEEAVRPIIPRLPWMDRASVVQGYAGVYSSFLLHAQRAAGRYGVPAHAILQRVGEASYVGGQGDMIIDVALQLQREQERART